jgi:hypothetical protein
MGSVGPYWIGALDTIAAAVPLLAVAPLAAAAAGHHPAGGAAARPERQHHHRAGHPDDHRGVRRRPVDDRRPRLIPLVWLPLTVSGTHVSLAWHDAWSIDVTTGSWST